MKQSVLVGGLVGLVATCFGATAMAGEEGERVLPFSGFDKVAVAGVYDLEVVVGQPHSVRIRGSSAELEQVVAQVRRETLILDLKDRRAAQRKKRHPLTAYVTTPTLVALDMSGVVDAEVTGIKATLFKVAISGVGETQLSGSCRQLAAEVSGVGELDATGLRCEHVSVLVSGVGEAGVFASEAVDATVSGMGDIRVIGSPKKVKKSGGLFADISVQ